MLDDESPTPANLGNRNTISIGTRLFGKTQSKVIRAYAQNVQYHTTVEESRITCDKFLNF